MAHLLLEIGTEELPASVVEDALAQLQRAVTQRMEGARIAFEEAQTYGTPRRLILLVREVAPTQTDIIREVRGPAANIAFDAQGNPTPAAIGFARKQGVPVDELQVVHTPQGDYVMAKVFEQGKPTGEVMQTILPEAIRSLTFPKMMRWGSVNLRFCRPIRWILALYGEQIIPFELEGIPSSNRSRGHRFLAPEEFEVSSPEQLFAQLSARYVMYDHRQRRESIRQQANQLAAQVGGSILWDEDLLDEVTHLVEYPTALLGRFDPHFLQLPEPVLITAMKKHQRFFAVADATGKLMPYFVAVRNGDDRYLDVVREGNERVLTARFNDAYFFYERDRQQPLEAFTAKLRRIVFQEKLGTMADKAERLRHLATSLASHINVAPAIAERAALLCKADLATEVVMELPSLQGIMGREYARLCGEPEEIAQAIAEHYQPRHAGDALPQTPLGSLLSVGDRVDTLVGYVAALGITPSGSADPFGLRRAAQGVVQILATQDTMPSLWQTVAVAQQSYATQGVQVSEEGLKALAQLFVQRMEALLEEEGVRYDIIQAVLAEERIEPYLARAAAHWLQLLPSDRLVAVAQAATRVRNILKSSEASQTVASSIWCPASHWLQQVRSALFQHEAEQLVYQRALQVEPFVQNASQQRQPDQAFSALEQLTQPINQLFDAVLIMAPDQALRQNRLLLLAGVDALYRSLADFSRLAL